MLVFCTTLALSLASKLANNANCRETTSPNLWGVVSVLRSKKSQSTNQRVKYEVVVNSIWPPCYLFCPYSEANCNNCKKVEDVKPPRLRSVILENFRTGILRSHFTVYLYSSVVLYVVQYRCKNVHRNSILEVDLRKKEVIEQKGMDRCPYEQLTNTQDTVPTYQFSRRALVLNSALYNMLEWPPISILYEECEVTVGQIIPMLFRPLWVKFRCCDFVPIILKTQYRRIVHVYPHKHVQCGWRLPQGNSSTEALRAHRRSGFKTLCWWSQVCNATRKAFKTGHRFELQHQS